MSQSQPLPTIEITDNPSSARQKALLQSLRHFNANTMGYNDAWPLFLSITDGKDRLQAGLSGRTIYGHLLIEALWVDESLRGQGLGSLLMAEAERIAIERGCYGAQVDTVSFQGQDFYPRFGFVCVGTVENFPPGHTRLFFHKDYRNSSEVPKDN
ncbi:GNAT family N-acetyltransferase [Pokkaliibacter sp. CJK22405]|uniref:GNAT family N-acetyltransferase n=1 Tax=Pokkaliibacter sp. CJK22405 TaxID=3384615 RepID=UPI0039854E48